MILTNADGRQEIDLLPPQPAPGEAAATLPEPVCPQGLASAFADDGMEGPRGPGASPLDEGLAQLHEEFGAAEGGES